MSARDLPAEFRAGPGCQLRPGASVAPGTRLGRHVVVGPNAAFVDAEPGQDPAAVEDGVSVGAGAVVFAGQMPGRACVVRPGAVVQRSVPPGAIAEGKPAAPVLRVFASHHYDAADCIREYDRFIAAIQGASDR
jgi:acetyltransferase-like isoleucine patch superfamily enzyme